VPAEVVAPGVEGLADAGEVERCWRCGCCRVGIGCTGRRRRGDDLGEVLGVRQIPRLGDDLGHLLGLPLPAGLLLLVVHGSR